MERGTAVPAIAGGTLGKIYAYSPHYKVEQLNPQFAARYNLNAYKTAMNIGFFCFCFGWFQMLSCWTLIIWIGAMHLCALILPYFGQIMHRICHPATGTLDYRQPPCLPAANLAFELLRGQRPSTLPTRSSTSSLSSSTGAAASPMAARGFRSSLARR